MPGRRRRPRRSRRPRRRRRRRRRRRSPGHRRIAMRHPQFLRILMGINGLGWGGEGPLDGRRKSARLGANL
jgi:hypothetical protein